MNFFRTFYFQRNRNSGSKSYGCFSLIFHIASRPSFPPALSRTEGLHKARKCSLQHPHQLRPQSTAGKEDTTSGLRQTLGNKVPSIGQGVCAVTLVHQGIYHQWRGFKVSSLSDGGCWGARLPLFIPFFLRSQNHQAPYSELLKRSVGLGLATDVVMEWVPGIVFPGEGADY